MNPSTSLLVTGVGALSTTEKNTYRSNATASSVLGLARARKKSMYSSTNGWPTVTTGTDWFDCTTTHGFQRTGPHLPGSATTIAATRGSPTYHPKCSGQPAHNKRTITPTDNWVLVLRGKSQSSTGPPTYPPRFGRAARRLLVIEHDRRADLSGTWGAGFSRAWCQTASRSTCPSHDGEAWPAARMAEGQGQRVDRRPSAVRAPSHSSPLGGSC